MKLLEKHLQLAIRAHNGTSFSPEKRGRDYIDSYSKLLEDDLEYVKKYKGDLVRYAAKFESLFVDWMHSKGNCISSMITGPSNFPTRSAEKRNGWERNKANALEDFRQRALSAIKKRYDRENAPDPLTEARQRFEGESALLERMKESNKIIKSKKLTHEEKIEKLIELGFSSQSAHDLFIPDWGNKIGFASFELTNCRNRMKGAQARVEELERRAAGESEETEREDGIKIVENVAENRLQVFFPDKPDADTRNSLKGSGFRWAPSNGCWQAYLNDRAMSKLLAIL